MEKLKELYKDLISRFKYLESEDAAELYGNDLEGRKKENIQIMVAIGEIVIEGNSLDDFSSNLLKSNQELIKKNAFQLGSQVRIKKEYQQSDDVGKLFYIVCYTEYINGEKWYNLAIDKDVINWIPLMYKDNQIELV